VQPERQAGPSPSVSGVQHAGGFATEDGEQSLGGRWAACSLDNPDIHDVSHMSSILQQLQPEAPHPIAQPEQPDLSFSIANHDEELDDLPVEQPGSEPARVAPEASVSAQEHAQAETSSLNKSTIRSTGSPGNVPVIHVMDDRSPLDFHGASRNSDEMSNTSQSRVHPEGGFRPEEPPKSPILYAQKSSSVDSDQISELPESKSSRS